MSENTDMKQIIIQKKFESINFSAPNGTFVTKDEIENNFLTTLTDKPKLIHGPRKSQSFFFTFVTG